MSYRVNFTGVGYTAPSPENPKGIKVRGTGYIKVAGERPTRNIAIPFEIIQKCKAAFMKECRIERYEDDKPGIEHFPSVWL